MRKLLLAGLVLLSSLTMWSQATTAQTVKVSVARQTSRQISDAIQARITESELAEEGPRHQAWFNFAHEYASGDVLGIDFSGHAYAPLIGVDFAISDFYLGLTLQYLRFNAEFSPAQFTSDLDANLYGIAPYVAWVISDYFFASLLVGYYGIDPDADTFSYLASEEFQFPSPCRSCPRPDPPSETVTKRFRILNIDMIHSGFYEIDFNAMLSRERLEVIVKAGFNHDFSKISGGDFDHIYTFIAGGDVGYRIGTVKHYVRAWWEGDIDDTREGLLPHHFFISNPPPSHPKGPARP